MKTIKIYSLIIVTVIVSVLITSCVEDSNFEVPVATEAEPSFLSETVNGELVYNETTFSAVKSALAQAQGDGESVVAFEGNTYITGYVISSDAAGNFFEELIIQNSTDGEDQNGQRLGIQLEINVSSLYQTYEFGRKVYVKLDGLAAGLSSEDEGVLLLGKADGNTIGQIEAFEYTDIVFRSPEVVNIEPKVIALTSIDENDVNTYVQVQSAQFAKSDLGLTLAGESTDEFDGERTLESCEDGGSITFETSTFADFKSLPVPTNSGAVSGVLTKNFFGDANVFKVNTFSGFDLEGERCDPEVLDCDGITATDVVIFEEDFQSISNESQLDTMGWTNVNISGGSERYEEDSFSGDTYLKISAFGTDEDPLEAWLVTPAINLDSTVEEELSFEISANFETGQILTAFITENYTGDPTTTEWVELDADIPIGDDGFGDFVQRTINISCLNGDVHFAFRYVGASDGAETRYHIDDIKVTGR